jgi:hypothetical protein
LRSEVLETSLKASPHNPHAGKRVWREKSTRGEELPASPIQGEDVVQGEIVTPKVCITIEEDNKWMPTTGAIAFQLLPTIF